MNQNFKIGLFTKDFQFFSLESKIEEQYIISLRKTCNTEKIKSKLFKIIFSKILILMIYFKLLFFLFAEENLLWQARYSGNSNLLNRAHNYATPSCDQLERIYTY